MRFDDDRTYDLGSDPDGSGFSKVADRMVGGQYYPPDVLTLGRLGDPAKALVARERVLQISPLFGSLGGPSLKSSVEFFVVDREDSKCHIGYVTTDFHFGRGIWQAELRRVESRLSLHVWSTAFPHNWLFWAGLPYARWLQLRARRRAVEEFRRLLSLS